MINQTPGGIFVFDGPRPKPPPQKHWFWDLPEEAQEKILALVHEGMRWRGWDRHHESLMGDHAKRAIEKIAEVCLENGHSVEEYT